jgi:hypothetical protein
MIVVAKVSSVLVGDGDDDRTQRLRKWARLNQLAELEGWSGRAAQRVTPFLTSAVDTYRVPYVRLPALHPRQ